MPIFSISIIVIFVQKYSNIAYGDIIKLKNFAKFNIDIFLRKIPIIDIENIGKKKPMAEPKSS